MFRVFSKLLLGYSGCFGDCEGLLWVIFVLLLEIFEGVLSGCYVVLHDC